jgi:LmbE family N-acetylglucosaminyl deacetylase
MNENLILPENQNILAVFAHPDDDVFGPSGFILSLIERKNHIYEIFLTNGDSGSNQKTGKKEKDLGEKRKKEAQNSASFIGVKEVFFLGFADGFLSNNLYHDVSGKIKKIADKINPAVFLTFEPRGISGHVDHFFTSMTVSFIASKLKKKVFYYCLSKKQRRLFKDYFIFFPEGYNESEIDLKLNVEKYREKKEQLIKIHQTQIKDGETILKNIKKQKPLVENFLVKDFFNE